MTVAELITVLESLDPDARVLIMSQPQWPFEYDTAGVVVREDFTDDGNEDAVPRIGDVNANDVFVLEGTQLRYGSKAAWDAERRNR